MDNQTIFLALIAVFVAISAAALIFQAAMLYGTYKASREVVSPAEPNAPVAHEAAQ